MEHQIIEKFYVVGISTRTTNANGQSAHDIEILWNRFWDNQVPKKITNKTNEAIYAVYTDYETDHTGPYSTIIGFAVSDLTTIPEGLVGITIEKTSYKNITSKGKMPEAVFNTWLAIWADKQLSSQRTYKADFTIHGEKYHDSDNAEVETYLSITE